MTEAPTLTEKAKEQHDHINNATKNLDYAKIKYHLKKQICDFRLESCKYNMKLYKYPLD